MAMEELHEADNGLWTFHQPLSVLGAEIGSRMTVVRLGDGSLLIHSPIALTPPLRQRLDAVGPVRHVLAPNLDHYLFVEQFRAAYRDARYYAAPGVAEKLRSVTFDVTLSPPANVRAWEDVLDQRWFRSNESLQELVLFHRASRTLVAADLAFNIQSSDGVLSRLLLRLNDSYRSFGPSRVCRRHITAPHLARVDLDGIIALNPERLIVGHGEIVWSGAGAALRRAYQWLT
jgi:glyoxylase-like metal-dependent hydrolase (beta-lactamase superfamily II)